MKTADIQVEYIGHYGSDATVANAARVSFHKEVSDMDEKEEKLIRYLAKHKHLSPFNHAFLSFRIKIPIFCARQMVKHKFLPWNEVSRRYVDSEPEFYIPSLRMRAENVKQGSSNELMDGCWGQAGNEHIQNMLSFYLAAIDAGMAPEVARAYLPQNMMTEVIWSGTLGAFCDMLRLRLDPHAQYESRIVAKKILEIVSPLFPVSVAALLELEAK